jgi:phage baseplate assembly protein W
MATRPLKDIIFKDLDITFAKHPITNQPAVLKNENAISRAVKNLVLTNKYERRFRPNVYSDVIASLFENFDPITVQIISNDVKNVVKNYEPRAELLRVNLVEDLDHNGFTISITYRPLNFKDLVIIDVFIERVR